MLLDVEVAGVKEGPEATSLGLGENKVPGFAENEGDDVKEELRDEDGLRPEVEDLSEDGGAAKGEERRWRSSMACGGCGTYKQVRPSPRTHMRNVKTGRVGSSSSETQLHEQTLSRKLQKPTKRSLPGGDVFGSLDRTLLAIRKPMLSCSRQR